MPIETTHKHCPDCGAELWKDFDADSEVPELVYICPSCGDKKEPALSNAQ